MTLYIQMSSIVRAYTVAFVYVSQSHQFI